MSVVLSRGEARRGRPFKECCRPDAVATPASTNRWFVTSQLAEPRLVDGRPEERPASLIHAKRMGSMLTACGTPATTWPRFFGLAFPAVGGVVCRDCLNAVRTSEGARR